MIEAFLWGAIAASSLLLGCLLALKVTIPHRTVGLIMGFGAGVLLSAVAYDLVLEAAQTETRNAIVFGGLLAGAIAFFLANRFQQRRSQRNGATGGQAQIAAGMALILGAIMDGVPESIVLGLTLLDGEGVGVTVLLAILLSNLPEGIAATQDLTESGWAGARIIRIWTIVVIVSAFASFAGYALFGNASPNTIAAVQAFAAGAIIVMLTDSMIPEAYAKGGNVVGLVTALGFSTAFGLTLLEWI